MNKKQELKSIIDALNNFMGKIDSVDEPKEQPKYPEGILSFKDGDTIFNHINFNHPVTYNQWVEAYMRLNIPIHSVKNSEEEVFTVGDEVEYIQKNDYYEKFNVGQFKIDNGKFIMAATQSNPRTAWNIEFLTKVEPKKPLFKTEDGFDVFEQDQYFQIHEDVSGYVVTNAFLKATYYIDNPAIRFKEKANADKYVAENRKSISYKELEDWVRKHGIISVGFTTPLLCDIEQLLNHFKPKQ